MAGPLDNEIRKLAAGRCEYCQMPEAASVFRHVLDHVIARQHGGTTTADNRALCCGRCNSHKGPNVSGIDPVTRQLTRLFHPRRDRWKEHFAWNGPVLVGLTDVGRTTIAVLDINDGNRVVSRQSLMDEGLLPTPESNRQ